MRKWFTRHNLGLVAGVVLFALSVLAFTPAGVRAQANVLNYFSQADSSGDNALHLGGSLYFGDHRSQFSTTTLTNAQVLALDATPITLVAAPGSGYYVDVIGAAVLFDYTAAYSGGSNLQLFWGSRTAGNAASAAITASGFLDGSADKIVKVTGVPTGTNPPTSSLALVIQAVAATAWGGGNASNAVTVVVEYRIIKTGL